MIASGEVEEKALDTQRQTAFRENRELQDARAAADLALKQFPGLSVNNLFDDSQKLEDVKAFIVEDMGIRDPDNMVSILPKLMIQAEQMTHMKMGPLDKLLYLVMLYRARREKR